MVPAAQNDGPVRPVAEPLVDAFGDGLDAIAYGLVLRNGRAARRRRLDEREDAAMLRIGFEQALHRQQPLFDALGVVQTVDPDADLRVVAQPELGDHRSAAFLGRGRALRPPVGPVDRDGVRPHEGAHTSIYDGVELPVDAGFEIAIHRVEEVVAVELRVESEDAAAQQPVQQLLGPRADAQTLEVGPGDVPERDDRGFGQPLANHPRDQREVVVLHEDDRVVGVHFLQRGLGELAIHRLVVRPVARTEHRAGVRDVAQRPQALVGEAVVVTALFLLGQPHAAQQVRVLARRHVDEVLGVHRLAIGGAAAVRDPDARTSAHHRLERGDQARGRMMHDDPAVAIEVVDVRLAIGEHDDAFAEQISLERILQSLRRPGAGRAVQLAFEAQPVDQLADVLEQRLELGLVHAAAQHPADFVGPAAPRHARQDNREQRGRARQHGEGADQQPLQLPFTGLRKATVVQQHQEANRLAALGYRQGAQIEVVVPRRDAAVPAGPLRSRRIGDRTHARGDSRHVTRAGHALVAATRLPSRVQAAAATTRSSRVRSVSSAPSRSVEPVIQLVTRAGLAPRKRQLRPRGQVAVDPLLDCPADEERRRQDKEAQTGQHDQREA